jgi:chromosome segregation ATPase
MESYKEKELTPEEKEKLIDEERKKIADEALKLAIKEYQEIVSFDLKDKSREGAISEWRTLATIFSEKLHEFIEEIWEKYIRPEEIKEEIEKLKEEIEERKRYLEEEKKKLNELEEEIEKEEDDSLRWKGLNKQKNEVLERINSLSKRISEREERILKLNTEILEKEKEAEEVKNFIPLIIRETEESYKKWWEEAKNEKDWSKYESWQYELKGHFYHIIDEDKIKSDYLEKIFNLEDKIKKEEKEEEN